MLRLDDHVQLHSEQHDDVDIVLLDDGTNAAANTAEVREQVEQREVVELEGLLGEGEAQRHCVCQRCEVVVVNWG